MHTKCEEKHYFLVHCFQKKKKKKAPKVNKQARLKAENRNVSDSCLKHCEIESEYEIF